MFGYPLQIDINNKIKIAKICNYILSFAFNLW